MELHLWCVDDFHRDGGSLEAVLMPAFHWVAIESGLEDDPKLLSFARSLRIKRETAFWYLYRWRVLVVQQGEHLTGSLPKKYSAQDIASFVDFPGEPRRLVSAMKMAGFLGYKKGRGFFYPGWTGTVTGEFAARRVGDRARKLREREERRLLQRPVQAPVVDVIGWSVDVPGDRPRTAPGHPEGSNEESPDRPPDSPPAGGALLADERWGWLMKHAPTPQNPDRCKRLLVAMSEDEWAMVVRAYGRLQQPRSLLSQKEKRDLRVLNWATDKFLTEHAYLRFRIFERPKISPPRSPGASPMVRMADDLKQRLAASDDFALEFLRDPDQTDQAKADAKRRWAAVPENANRTPPWEAAGRAPSQNGASQ